MTPEGHFHLAAFFGPGPAQVCSWRVTAMPAAMTRPKRVILDGRCLCIGSCCCLNVTAAKKMPLNLDKLSRSGSFTSEETAMDDRSTSSSSRSHSAQWSDERSSSSSLQSSLLKTTRFVSLPPDEDERPKPRSLRPSVPTFSPILNSVLASTRGRPFLKRRPCTGEALRSVDREQLSEAKLAPQSGSDLWGAAREKFRPTVSSHFLFPPAECVLTRCFEAF
eukprot:s287_g7.t1